MKSLPLDQLHASLSDPLLGSMNFLNEIMDRYPDAISFAPGAPYAGLLDDFDPAACIRRYSDYLAERRGLNPAQVNKRLYQYGPARGLINDLLATSLRIDQQIDVAPRDIVVTVGAQEGMLLCLRALFRDDQDLLAVVNPSFVGINGAARLLDIATRPVPESEDGQGVDCDALERLCVQARDDGRRIRAVYVSPDFSNPSGSLMPLVARRRMLQLADEFGFLILEDNAYGFTAEQGSALPTLLALDRLHADGRSRVVYLGTCAKICVPGLRVGFVVAGQRVDRGDGGTLADELATLKSMVSVNTSPLCQAMVGGLLLEHGGSLDAIARSKAGLYRRNLDTLLRALHRRLGADTAGAPQGDRRVLSDGSSMAGVRWNRPHGGFFVRMHLPVPASAELLHLSASRYGVLWTPMSTFHLDGEGRYDLRLSCSYLDEGQIREGVDRLAAFLEDPMVNAPGSASIGARAGEIASASVHVRPALVMP